MASQRMIKLALVETNKFMELPLSAQYLYYNLILRGDDDGFVGNTKLILSFCGAGMDDMELLRDKGYIIIFDSGVCVIRHWKHHNHIRPSIYKETFFTEEREQVYLNDKDIYELKDSSEPAAHVCCNFASEVKGNAVADGAEVNDKSCISENGLEHTNNSGIKSVSTNSASEVSKGKINKVKESKGKVCSGEVSSGKVNSSGKQNTFTHTEQTHTEPDDDIPVMTLPALNGDYCITQDKFTELKHTYPDMDIMNSLEKIKNYLTSHPEKLRTKKATEGYIDLWLSDDAKKRPVSRKKKQTAAESSNAAEYDEYSDYENSSVIDMFGQMEGYEDLAEIFNEPDKDDYANDKKRYNADDVLPPDFL